MKCRGINWLNQMVIRYLENIINNSYAKYIVVSRTIVRYTVHGDLMKHIEQFNYALNSSVASDNSIMKETVDFVIRYALRSLSNRNQILIIGAGKCQDFSLSVFLDEFDKVVLTDVDLESMKKCVNQRNVTVQQVEYTGFEQHAFFDDFKERIVNARDFDKIDQIIEHKMKPIHNYVFLEEEFGTYDMVYVSPIYTQLVYNQVLREVSILRESGYPEHLLKYIENKMLDEMIGVINRFNDNVMKLLHKEGRLLVLSDVFELNVGSEFHLRVANSIRNKSVMDEIYERYRNKYGMGLGDYGLFNLDEQMINVHSRWMMWQFTNEREFAIKLNIYKNLVLKGGLQ